MGEAVVKRYLGIVFLIVVGMSNLKAQDPQFTQFYASPLYINPAYAGTTIQQRFTLQTRIQWPTLPQSFTSYIAAYDFNFDVLNSGFGIMAWTDKQGTVDLRTTNASLTYAYRVQFPGNWVLSAGVQLGAGWRSIDRNKFILSDQFDFAGGLGQTGDPDIALLETNINYFDFAAGGLAYTEVAWIGVSAYHLNEPNQSFLGGDSPLPMRWNAHGGISFPLYQGVFRRTRIPTLTPGFYYKKQGEFDQLDLGANFNYNPIMIGLWYRGIPIFDDVLSNVRSQDAISLLLGMRFQKLEVGYSYDVTVSSLGANSGGAHEISLIYQFAYESPAPKKKTRAIPCPSFNTSVLDEFKY